MTNKLKKISRSVWEWFKDDAIPFIIVWVVVLFAAVCANIITGCAQLSKIFPETAKEAATVSPELREVVDKKGAETIKKGKAEGIKKIEKL